MGFWRCSEIDGIKQRSLCSSEDGAISGCCFLPFLSPTIATLPITLRDRKDSLIDEVFSFSIDMDGAQALQRGEDVGKQRGPTVVLQSLEHTDGPLEHSALRTGVSDLSHPPLTPSSSRSVLDSYP